MQDIIKVDSSNVAQTSFNTSFDTKSIVNFYAIGSSSSLTHYHSKEHKNLSIKDSTSQPSDYLVLAQKWDIIKHVGSRKPHWILENIVTSIR